MLLTFRCLILNPRVMTKEQGESNARERESRADNDRSELPLEIDVRELLGDRREVTIIHAGERYRLRITANNKLILTK